MIEIKKVLISDSIDAEAINILRQRNIECDLKTGLDKEELMAIIKVKDLFFLTTNAGHVIYNQFFYC